MGYLDIGFGKSIALRVQVPNKNIILAQNLYYNYYYPKCKYLIIGYLDPLGSLSDFGVQGAGFRYSALGGLESGVLGFRVGGLGMVEGLLGAWHEDRLEEMRETSNLDQNFSTCHQAQLSRKLRRLLGAGQLHEPLSGKNVSSEAQHTPPQHPAKGFGFRD